MNDGAERIDEDGRGVTLRDFFAAHAMAAIIQKRDPKDHGTADPADLADAAFEYADAMIEVRALPPPDEDDAGPESA